ncbi:hypothetical protein JJD91_003415 [Salmonella enterica]|nr:hypothetical protein [Salmonella enterica]EHK3516027.1 hypothetical protein [Salmonella enterica]
MKKPTQNEYIAMLTTSTGQELEYSRQALAVLDMWMDLLTHDEAMESRRVAAVYSLVREAASYLEKAQEVTA